jgi:hypothetical protein
MRRTPPFLVLLALAACDGHAGLADAGSDAPAPGCEAPPQIQLGDAHGHPEPLRAGPGEARAGRIPGSAIPQHPSRMGVWDEGGFVVANHRIAMVIEDVGPSQLYDPWGGRPLAIARVEDGRLVDVGDFGEILLLTGRYTVMTTSVTVLSDGSDGGPAIVRAAGPMRPLPFFEAITSPLLPTAYDEVDAAIDYVLEPDSSHVDVRFTFASRATTPRRAPLTLHAFMYTPRMPAFAPGPGFAPSRTDQLPYLAFTDERGVGYAYADPDSPLRIGVEVSGFVSRFAPPVTVLPCAITESHHARIWIGGLGVDGLIATVEAERGTALRRIEGVVRDASEAPAAGVRVHAIGGDGAYLTRSLPTGEDGRYALHVPAGAAVRLYAYRQGDAIVGPVDVAADESRRDLTLAPGGWVEVRVRDADGAAVPARIQILPAAGTPLPDPPREWGESTPTAGRVQVALSGRGEARLRVPAGRWRVVMSRGYEYEIDETEIRVERDGEIIEVNGTLERVVDTPGVQCADFHIHTRRSNDSPDDEDWKVLAAAADGLEIPVRSDHEFVADFTSSVARLGLQNFVAGGVGSVEMTSMEIWGHMGVVPLTPDPSRPNAGAPLWQEWPTPEDPTAPVRTLSPVDVFRTVRARPEAPTIIINHPGGSTNYFGYTGYDPVTGTVARPEAWDDEFTAVEFFNDADWRAERDRMVPAWLSFLDHGRRVFAVGSSDSHHLTSSPVGYPRTCLVLGTDDPRAVVPSAVRDAVARGRSSISGGIFVDVNVGDAGPGEEAAGLGPRAMVHVRVQAASWVDVDAIEVIVDGRSETIDVLPSDATDPLRPWVRFERDLAVDVAEGRGSYVVVAAYGDRTLEPVHPGRVAFGVANPVFLRR